MADEQSLPELIVKEAVGAGLDSSMRETILEAVEDAEGARGGPSIPITAGAFGIGAAIGYVLGSREPASVETVDESLPVEFETESEESGASDDETETDDGNGGSRLVRLLVLLAVGGAIAYLRSRRGGEEGWEPIDEFDQSLDEGVATVTEGLADETAEEETGPRAGESAAEEGTSDEESTAIAEEEEEEPTEDESESNQDE